MRTLNLTSPAKINIYLKVLNKRLDGFHNIITVFEKLNLKDKILLKENLQGSIRVFCNHPQVPTGPKNLVYKVAKLLRDNHGIKKGVDITIQKNIPVAAGLAGGSSNAACVLKGLNRLWQLHLSQDKLLNYARQIGSDVAFFLYDYRWALGTERGDQIQKINLNTKLWHVLVVPKKKIYSGDVYEGLNLSAASQNDVKSTNNVDYNKKAPLRNVLTHAKHLDKLKLEDQRTSDFLSDSTNFLTPSEKSNIGGTNVLTKNKYNVTILIHNLKKNKTLEAVRFFSNDLEPSIIRIAPSLVKLKKKLKSLDCQGVMISGSGPCVFGVVGSESEGCKVRKELIRRYKQVFIVRTF